jgi:hypothetical protein
MGTIMEYKPGSTGANRLARHTSRTEARVIRCDCC